MIANAQRMRLGEGWGGGRKGCVCRELRERGGGNMGGCRELRERERRCPELREDVRN